jgi:hypothetical protein
MIRTASLLLIAATACSTAERDSGTTPPRSLLDYLRSSQAEEIPRSAAQIVDDSDVIVTGTVAAVAEGRTVDFAEGPSHPIPMAVLEVTPTEAVKGEVGPSVYFEYIRGGASAEMLSKRLPQEQLMFFLHESLNWDSATYKSDDRSRGLPDGATLYELTSQRGLLMESNGRVTQALDPSDQQLFSGATLDDVIGEVQDLMIAEPSSTP